MQILVRSCLYSFRNLSKGELRKLDKYACFTSLRVARYSSSNTNPTSTTPPTSDFAAPASGSGSPKTGSNLEYEVIPKIKTTLKYDDTVKSRKYLTPTRALTEYSLQLSDLDDLPRFYSRSPYTNEVRAQVFLRSDVEKLALEKYGGEEGLKRQQMIETEYDRLEKIIKFSRRRWKNEQGKSQGFSAAAHTPDQHRSTTSIATWQSGAGRVILLAIVINGLNVVGKALAWWYTGSKSMFSEMMHSVADTLNQVILAYGLHSSLQRPDLDHPYGYQRMRCISSLISGVGIFFLGSGFTFYHALQGVVMPLHENSLGLALYGSLAMLSLSLISEGSTLLVALAEVRRKAREQGVGLMEYLRSGTAEPSTSVVLLEDSAAVLGVAVAGSALAASVLTGSSWPDTVGGVVISGILAAVAGFIVRTNTDLLIGKSVPLDKQTAIMRFLDNAKIIRGTYDTKIVFIGGGSSLRLKAEVDIDGRELSKRFLENKRVGLLYESLKEVDSEEEMVTFLLNYGDELIDTLGAEINQIEENLKREFPDIKHIDIEVN